MPILQLRSAQTRTTEVSRAPAGPVQPRDIACSPAAAGTGLKAALAGFATAKGLTIGAPQPREAPKPVNLEPAVLAALPEWQRAIAPSLAGALVQPGAYGKLGLAIDTSTSIRPEMIARFALEAMAVAIVANAEICLMVFDFAVRRVWEFPATDALQTMQTLRLTGDGNGTDFRPPFQEAERRSCDAIMCFTDLDGALPSWNVEIPTVWAVPLGCNPASPPFGSVIQLPW